MGVERRRAVYRVGRQLVRRRCEELQTLRTCTAPWAAPRFDAVDLYSDLHSQRGAIWPEGLKVLRLRPC